MITVKLEIHFQLKREGGGGGGGDALRRQSYYTKTFQSLQTTHLHTQGLTLTNAKCQKRVKQIKIKECYLETF